MELSQEVCFERWNQNDYELRNGLGFFWHLGKACLVKTRNKGTDETNEKYTGKM